MRGNSEIRIDANRVSKRFARGVEVEHEKSVALWELGQQNGFCAPRPLRFDRTGETIEFERLRDLVSVRESYVAHLRGRGDHRATFAEVGRVLAVIHDRLLLPRRSYWIAPAAFWSPGWSESSIRALVDPSSTATFLHGDYGFANVFLQPSDDGRRLCVLDPSPNGYATVDTDVFGPAEVDLGTMLACLWGQVPPHRQVGLAWSRATGLMSAFLGGYERSLVSGASPRLDRSRLLGFARGIARAYFRSRYRLPFMRELAMRRLFSSRKHIDWEQI